MQIGISLISVITMGVNFFPLLEKEKVEKSWPAFILQCYGVGIKLAMI
mgnify:CR=1 FL=1